MKNRYEHKRKNPPVECIPELLKQSDLFRDHPSRIFIGDSRVIPDLIYAYDKLNEELKHIEAVMARTIDDCREYQQSQRKFIYSHMQSVKLGADTYLYLFTSRAPDVCKIGVSVNPWDRINHVCGAVDVIYAIGFDGGEAYTLENMLHRLYESQQVCRSASVYGVRGTEWFYLTPEDIAFIKSLGDD